MNIKQTTATKKITNGVKPIELLVFSDITCQTTYNELTDEHGQIQERTQTETQYIIPPNAEVLFKTTTPPKTDVIRERVIVSLSTLVIIVGFFVAKFIHQDIGYFIGIVALSIAKIMFISQSNKAQTTLKNKDNL